jgi:hypothetical protein
MAVDLGRFFDVLANPARLRIVGLLALQGRTVEELAGLLDLKAAVVSRHLARLRGLGLVGTAREGRRLRYSLDSEVLNQWAAGLAAYRRPRPEGGMESEDEEQRRVLSDFIVDGRLTGLPARRAKRLVVLGWLAGLFRPGERYLEAQVNEMLKRYHDDPATLRRAMVDEELMQRRAGVYWRAGTLPFPD